jgi:hypothetical protein
MMSFDVFISYSSKDKSVADAACAALEAAGVRCWIAPRDVSPGADWGASIVEALDECKAMVLIFSSSANESPQIRNEVVRAVNNGITLIPVRIENIEPTKALAYFMGAVHWLDALTPPLDQHLKQLAASLKALLQVNKTALAQHVMPHELVTTTSTPTSQTISQRQSNSWKAVVEQCSIAGWWVVLYNAREQHRLGASTADMLSDAANFGLMLDGKKIADAKSTRSSSVHIQD